MSTYHLIKSLPIISGLVLFLEEDHYVAEDFLHLLDLMQTRANQLCAKCNILSLGTYLKTFNYYTYAQGGKVIRASLFFIFFTVHIHTELCCCDYSWFSIVGEEHMKFIGYIVLHV